MSKLQNELRRLELLNNAQQNFIETIGGFDPINYLTYNDGAELMRLDYELGYSDYNPEEVK